MAYSIRNATRARKTNRQPCQNSLEFLWPCSSKNETFLIIGIICIWIKGCLQGASSVAWNSELSRKLRWFRYASLFPTPQKKPPLPWPRKGQYRLAPGRGGSCQKIGINACYLLYSKIAELARKYHANMQLNTQLHHKHNIH